MSKSKSGSSIKYTTRTGVNGRTSHTTRVRNGSTTTTTTVGSNGKKRSTMRTTSGGRTYSKRIT